MLDINKHLDHLKASATLAINQEVQLLKSKGGDIVHFGFGQSPFPVYHRIVMALQDHAEHNEYLPTLGLTTLRQQIAHFLEFHQDVKRAWANIFIGPGSKELLYHTILILEGEFLIPKGSWVSYAPQIKTKGGKCTILETDFSNNFKLTSETLERHCKAHPGDQKILILNSPNNPTGAVYTIKELQELTEVCRRYKIVVLSDEIYSQINFSEAFSPSISKFYSEGSIVYGGLSKVFSAGGYRLGFIAIPDEMTQLNATFKAIFSETFSAVASPVQYAAIEAFKMSDGLFNYVKKCKLVLKAIADFTFKELKSMNISCTQPQGAFYMMIGFDNFQAQLNAMGIKTSTDLAHYLLQTHHVAFLPGSDFYLADDELFLRMAFVDFDGKKLLENCSDSTEFSIDFISENCPNIVKGINRLKVFLEDLQS